MTASAHRGKAEKKNREGAMLRAALVVFADAGLRDGRIEDIAAMAGVSKGAVYLSFPSKAALFRVAVRFAIASLSEGRAEMERELVRIMVHDGVHFPDLAECCSRELIVPRLEAVRALGSLAALSETSPYVRFPQLALAPGSFALVWNALFGKIDPLNEEEFEESFRHFLPVSLPLDAIVDQGAADGA